MKLQQLVAALLCFIVVLIVGIYVLHVIAAALFPSAGVWVIYGLPELLGLALAIAAAYLGWKLSGNTRSAED